MRDCRVEEVSHITDSDEDSDTPPQTADLTIGVFPSHQSPTYFIMANKGDKVGGEGPGRGWRGLEGRWMGRDGERR